MDLKSLHISASLQVSCSWQQCTSYSAVTSTVEYTAFVTCCWCTCCLVRWLSPAVVFPSRLAQENEKARLTRWWREKIYWSQGSILESWNVVTRKCNSTCQIFFHLQLIISKISTAFSAIYLVFWSCVAIANAVWSKEYPRLSPHQTF